MSLGGKDQRTGGGVRSDGSELSGAQSAVEFVLTVTAAKWQDVAYRTVPLLPYGTPVYATAAGSAAADTTVWVEPPHGVTLQKPTLSILIGPTVAQPVGRVAGAAPAVSGGGRSHRLGLGERHQRSDWRWVCKSCSAAATPRRRHGVGRPHPRGHRPALGPPRRGRRLRVGPAAAGTASGLPAPRALGRWGSHGKPAITSLTASSGKGRRMGARAIGRHGRQRLQSKAILLNTLATLEKADFALANRLYRERQRLSAAALANLSLALAEMDRATMAAELLDLLATRSDERRSRRRGPVTAGEPIAGRNPTAGRWRLRRLPLARRRPSSLSIGCWPIATATAGRPTRPPVRPCSRCAAGLP